MKTKFKSKSMMKPCKNGLSHIRRGSGSINSFVEQGGIIPRERSVEHLFNDLCSIEYRIGKKEIFGRDCTDHFNDPAFYSKSKRGLDKAWEALKGMFTPETKMFDVINQLSDNGIRTHYWCMVD